MTAALSALLGIALGFVAGVMVQVAYLAMTGKGKFGSRKWEKHTVIGPGGQWHWYDGLAPCPTCARGDAAEDDATDRAPGFYWVLYGKEWVPAEYTIHTYHQVPGWGLTGNTRAFLDEDFKAIGPRLGLGPLGKVVIEGHAISPRTWNAPERDGG